MNLIVAVDTQNAIGKNNQLLDHFKEDMKYFKRLTTNKVVVMGKNTYLSLPAKNRPLPNRTNIILSSTMEDGEGYIVCHNIEELFKELDKYVDEDIFVIGGAKVYQSLYMYCNTFYITKILKKYEEADTFLNEINEIKKDCVLTNWHSVIENEVILDFLTYKANP